MSSPHFKPESSALVLIDLQIGTIQMIKNIMPEIAIRNAVLLGKAAQAYKMPIVMTSSLEEKVQGPLHPALQQAMRATAELTPDEAANRIVQEVQNWSKAQDDDLTVLVCDFRGNGSGPLTPATAD